MSSLNRNSPVFGSAAQRPASGPRPEVFGSLLGFALLLLFSAADATVREAHGQSFLPPAQVAEILADGRSWSGVMQDGRQVTITLNRDGTGSFRGPMPMVLSATWAIRGEDFCIRLRMAGLRCLRFRRVTGGLEGWRGDEPFMRLSR